MKEYTPKEKLKATKTMIHQHTLLFPVLLLENILRHISSINQFLNQQLDGKYVYATCQFLRVTRKVKYRCEVRPT